ncbi:hypothetical protein CRE_16813 [Caenorhabditis remanei]|uniref:Uncharacterized protein n=1 Tax=Caenorhabditis remanei TaxID=31234 RepID=E3MAL4_CAERE|nr:hypothetical protein CRE_16813 [Caenorhabditis remanei]
MELPKEEPILFKCIIPKTFNQQGIEATDFIRRSHWSFFCHVRFSRPMMEGDDLDFKVIFHDTPKVDGQLLLSVTPPEYHSAKAKTIIKRNPFVIDPTTSWISFLKDDDSKRYMRFGLKYLNGLIQLRLPGETGHFPFYHVQNNNESIRIDIFFCEYVKSISLRDPITYEQEGDEEPMIYRSLSHVLIM